MSNSQALTEACHSLSRRDAETLLAHVCGVDRVTLLMHPEREMQAEQYAMFLAFVQRRAAGEPLQYITGMQEFYGLALRVTPDVLVPRPETEHLVEAVLLWATHVREMRTLRIADVGTGSGAIAIALATHLAGTAITAIDNSKAALEIARGNAATHKCERAITFRLGDLLDGLEHEASFDAIVSNPPYIPTVDAATMQREVVEHEPHGALFAGKDGLDIYRRLIPQAHALLREGGLLALEIGFGQRDAICELLKGWGDVRFIDDYAGIPRVALAERSKGLSRLWR